MSDEVMNDKPLDSNLNLDAVYEAISECRRSVWQLGLSANRASTSGYGISVSAFLPEHDEALKSVFLLLCDASGKLDDLLNDVRDMNPQIKWHETLPKPTMGDGSKSKVSESSVGKGPGRTPVKKPARASTAAAALAPAVLPPPSVSRSGSPSASVSSSESSSALADQRKHRTSHEPIYFTNGETEVPGSEISPEDEKAVNKTIRLFFHGEKKLQNKCISRRIAGQGTAYVGDGLEEYSCFHCQKMNRYCISWEQGRDERKQGFVVRARYSPKQPVKWKD
ncbi:hypothetical protein NX059_009235 [Plenodomus lindquistii]|nr:hypothetical protein NX059_009235 [Plenodomus lindquistii]